MLIFRKVVFYIFVVAYVVLCPLTILYALGYVVRPGVEQGIVRTGLISLSTTPPGATVFVCNRRYARKTPTVLRNLLPGAYPVRLTLKHYQTWSQVLPVVAERAAALERILLIPKSWRPMVLVERAFEDLVPVPNTEFFLLRDGPRVQDYAIYDWRAERLRPLVVDASLAASAKVLAVHTVRDSPSVLMRLDGREGDEYLWVELRGKQASLAVTNLFQRKPLRVAWDPHEETLLFALESGHLNRLQVTSGKVMRGVVEGVRGYGLFNKRLYVLDEANVFRRMSLEGTSPEVLLNDPELSRTLFRGKGTYAVEVLSEELMVFLGERGELVANRLPYRLVEEGVRGLEVDAERKRLLLWTGERLGVLDFSLNGRKADGVFQKGPTLSWVQTEGRNLEQACWVYGDSHALVRDEDTVSLIELDGYGIPHVDDVVRVKRHSSIIYQEDSGMLYYLDRLTGTLSAIEIVPRRAPGLPAVADQWVGQTRGR